MAGPGGTITLTEDDDIFPRAGIDDNSGNETVYGLGGTDVLSGGAGNDVLYGGADFDILSDSEGTRVIIDGGSGDDRITLGGTTLVSGKIAGGAGNGYDTLFVLNDFNFGGFSVSGINGLVTNGFVVTAAASVFRDLNLGSIFGEASSGTVSLALAATGSAQTVDFTSKIANSGRLTLTGSSDDETLTGTGIGSSDFISGGGGDDRLYGAAGDDILQGDSGNDLLDGGAGTDIASYEYALAGVSVSLAITGPQAVGAGLGSDTLVDIEWLTGSRYDDTLGGNAGDNRFHGGRGNDRFNGGGGSDTVSYDGDDQSGGVTVDLRVASGQTVGGGQGVDTLVAIDSVIGTRFGDTLDGNDDANTLDGGFRNSGNDVLRGHGGADRIVSAAAGRTVTIDGGSGDDVVEANWSKAKGTVLGGEGFDTLTFASYDASDISTLAVSGFEVLETSAPPVLGTAAQFESFEIIRGIAAYADRSAALRLADTGTAQTLDLSDELQNGGGPRAVYLIGSSDRDLVTTGDGSDYLVDRGGDDAFKTRGGDDVIFDRKGAGTTIEAGDGDDFVVIGTSFTSGTLDGGRDEDTLTGTMLAPLTISGFEILHTGLIGATATAAQFDSFDTIRIDELTPTRGVNLTIAATGAAQSADLSDELDANGGPRAVDLTGSSDAETLASGSGKDIIDGLGGNDVLRAGLGDDRLDGGEGKDVLRGETGTDILAGGLGGDRLEGGDDNDRVGGDDGDDVLIAGTGNDRLDGGAGNDQLFGGSGNDVLAGGAGSDLFSFSNRFEGNDRIDDWSAIDDRIEIDASAFGGGLTAGALPADRLVVAAMPVADQAFGQFLFDAAKGQLSWDVDGTGAQAAVMLARFYGGGAVVTALTAGDFEIVA